MKKYSKKLLYTFICVLIGFIGGFTCLIYANNYSSEEISYDTSTSGAVQANVKDALDFLYNKTKSGASAECPENMSCVEKPGVVMNVTGPGSVNKGTVYVGLNESNTFTVTPNEGYTLASISCDNGYILGSYSVLSTAGMIPQEITITNPGVTIGASCSITFSTNELNVSSTQLHLTYKSDICFKEDPKCICWYIKYGGSNFTYGSHTECNFKSKSCYHTFKRSETFDCSKLSFNYHDNYWEELVGGANSYAACSGVITCET